MFIITSFRLALNVTKSINRYRETTVYSMDLEGYGEIVIQK